MPIFHRRIWKYKSSRSRYQRRFWTSYTRPLWIGFIFFKDSTAPCYRFIQWHQSRYHTYNAYNIYSWRKYGGILCLGFSSDLHKWDTSYFGDIWGEHVIAIVEMDYSKSFQKIQDTISFVLPQFTAFYPDLVTTFVGTNLSSLNIFQQDNYGETTFIQDYREKSVIAGFSVVGGLWTAFSGIFAILFGASMLHIFHGQYVSWHSEMVLIPVN